MPYLRIPCNREERKQFLEGGEKSLLYLALQHIADKECIHNEVFWHHVGLVDVPTKNHTTCKIAVLCDLQHIVACKDVVKRSEWVRSTFEMMKQGM